MLPLKRIALPETVICSHLTNGINQSDVPALAMFLIFLFWLTFNRGFVKRIVLSISY